MILKELCFFGVNRFTIQRLFKNFGLNGRLNSMNIKLIHKNRMLTELNDSNLTGKILEAKISNFKLFYQQINYNKSKLRNGKNSKKKIFKKVQKKK